MAQINLFRTANGDWKAIILDPQSEVSAEFASAVVDLLDSNNTVAVIDGDHEIRVLA